METVFRRSCFGLGQSLSCINRRSVPVACGGRPHVFIQSSQARRNIALASESEPAVDPITIGKRDSVTLIGLNRPHRRNAVNRDMARQLTVAFKAFENDEHSNVAVLHGKGDHFCAGYDLKELASSESKWILSEESLSHMSNHGAMGPSRLHLRKPVIAAVNGYAVSGGLELALFCDLRVFEKSTKVGILSRRFGVPLIDGGTVRLPALIGLSNALDLILTGRVIDADEAKNMGVANRVVDDGEALSAAVALGKMISQFPQGCLRADRESTFHSMYNSESKQASLNFELKNSLQVLATESIVGARRFKAGEGKGGVAIK